MENLTLLTKMDFVYGTEEELELSIDSTIYSSDDEALLNMKSANVFGTTFQTDCMIFKKNILIGLLMI